MCLASQMWPQAIVLILYSNVQNFLFSDQPLDPRNRCHFGEYPAVEKKRTVRRKI